MRLIDADELKKRAEEICFPDMPDCGNFYAVGVPDIDIMPTIDPESLRPTAHWVSVKDRLPDPYEKVLVRLDHWAGVDTYLAFYDTERGWCDYGGYFDDGTNNEGEPHTYETAGVNVTHWMSLPRLPEEEGYYV
jgi:hypothetical protein